MWTVWMLKWIDGRLESNSILTCTFVACGKKEKKIASYWFSRPFFFFPFSFSSASFFSSSPPPTPNTRRRYILINSPQCLYLPSIKSESKRIRWKMNHWRLANDPATGALDECRWLILDNTFNFISLYIWLLSLFFPRLLYCLHKYRRSL